MWGRDWKAYTCTLPTSVHLWFEVCLSGLVNYFLQLLACISKTTREGSHSMLWDRPRPQSCKHRHLTFSVRQNTSIGFGTINVPNAKGTIALACWTTIPFAFLPPPPQSNIGWREKQFSPSWHVLPVHWGGQIHLNPSTRSWQVPPWPQGFGEQSSISATRSKERLSSVTGQAMSVTDKFDKWLPLLGFAPRNRKTTGLLLGISRSTLISAKAPFKNNSSVKGGS